MSPNSQRNLFLTLLSQSPDNGSTQVALNPSGECRTLAFSIEGVPAHEQDELLEQIRLPISAAVKLGPTTVQYYHVFDTPITSEQLDAYHTLLNILLNHLFEDRAGAVHSAHYVLRQVDQTSLVRIPGHQGAELIGYSMQFGDCDLANFILRCLNLNQESENE